jgi:signal transduction histidine kinase/YHS domain-containing protein
MRDKPIMDTPLTISVLAIIILAAGNLWLVVRVLLPVRRLAAQTARLSGGDLRAFQQPCSGIAEIDTLRRTLASMAGHVRRAQQESLAYHSALTAGQEAERARIARELHDDTVQSLIAIAQSIELAGKWIEEQPARASDMLRLARAQAVESVDNLRRLIGDLRPPALEELGLVPALRILARDTNAIEVEVVISGKERRLDETRALALFRGAQEGVHNAGKHSGAERVRVEVAYAQDEVVLTVSDQGAGFVVPQPVSALVEGGRYGLTGMVERVESLGGQVSIRSAPGQGTIVTITLPVQPSAQPAATVRDPVCRADIQPDQAYASVIYEGETYYFCCPVCQGAFQRSPQTYLEHREDPA